MNWVVAGVQWLHVLLGITWFGAALYNALILVPSITPMSLGEQRRIGRAIGARAFTVLRPVALAVITLGVLRGTVFGPIKDLAQLTSPYGLTWLVALVFAIGAYFWAERVIGPALDRMNAIPEAAALDSDGRPSAELEAAVANVKRKSILELGFFFVIFTCMILMRFGL
ncbi:MAG TPA: hypothetical protein VM451_06075 [Candidatus Limnocylindria bacterium]|nr:hypothetical protein [Candidatus Limnocylindria bacterium]